MKSASTTLGSASTPTLTFPWSTTPPASWPHLSWRVCPPWQPPHQPHPHHCLLLLQPSLQLLWRSQGLRQSLTIPTSTSQLLLHSQSQLHGPTQSLLLSFIPPPSSNFSLSSTLFFSSIFFSIFILEIIPSSSAANHRQQRLQYLALHLLSSPSSPSRPTLLPFRLNVCSFCFWKYVSILILTTDCE